jgi:hypothetical protein
MFVWPTSHMGMMHPGGDTRARSMAKDFVTYAQASKAGTSYQAAKGLLSVSTNQAETRKSFYEELALLYVPYRSNQILLTPLGEQLFDVLAGVDLSIMSAAASRQATALIVWAMCKCQINRPQSRGVPSPTPAQWQSCDVRPYASAWSAIDDLGGDLFLHEFMGPLRKLHQASDYSAVIDQIRDGRRTGTILATPAELSARADMNYRIYWKSHLSVAEQILSWDEAQSALRAKKANWDIVRAALQFQAGCGRSTLAAIRSGTWSDADDYFMNVAGSACPPYLARGTPAITTFEGQTLVDLSKFELSKIGTSYRVKGGPQLCQLALKMPCYHPNSQDRLLRIDRKAQDPSGVIELELGLGRPIVNLGLLQKALEGGNAQ